MDKYENLLQLCRDFLAEYEDFIYDNPALTWPLDGALGDTLRPIYLIIHEEDKSEV